MDTVRQQKNDVLETPRLRQSTRPWVVFFGEDWGRLNSTGQYLARALTSSHRVLWVNSIGLRSPSLNLADSRRALGKLVAFVADGRAERAGAPDQPLPEGLHVASPLALPFLKHAVIRSVNRALLSRWLRLQQTRLGLQSPLVISACPATADIMDALNPIGKIYYCADDYAELPGMDRELVRALEAELMANCDLVLATSRALQASKAANHKDVRYFPHGVWFGHLNQAVSKPLPWPRDLEAIPAPLAGYVGLVGEHLDLQLLAAVADRLPDVSLVLIGPVEPALKSVLPRRPNLHYLGPRSYADIPAYLARFCVALLPWNRGRRNRYAHPTKLREYLAAGCPVVSTVHPEVDGISPYVVMADDAPAFAAAIRRRLNAGSTARAVIAAPMGGHDWSVRAEQLRAMLPGSISGGGQAA